MEHATVIALLLGTAIFIGTHGVLQRWIFQKGIFTKKEVLVGQNVVAAGVLFAALLLFGGLNPEAGNSRIFWIAILVTTVANVVIQWSNAQAREWAEASLTAPIQAMTPFLVTGAALFLGELPSMIGFVGIALIVLGTYVHALENARSWRDYFKPFLLLWLPSDFLLRSEAEQKQLRLNRNALALSYLSAGVGTFGLIGDSVAARTGDIALGFGVHLLALALCFSLLMPKDKVVLAPLSIRLQRHWIPLVGGGVAFGLLVVLPLLAFRVAPVAYVGSLKRLGIVATVLLAWWFLGEAKAPRRLIPAAIVTVGAILLFFDPASKAIVEAADGFLSGF